jgi:hypothetical protein
MDFFKHLKTNKMKQLILIITIALSFSACTKGEKCLINGTWTVDKIVAGNYTNRPNCQLKFTDNGFIMYYENKTYNINCTVTDKELIFTNGYKVKYDCSGNKLRLNTDVSIFRIILFVDEPIVSSTETYLSK